ncbi:helix-turn-helix domain-containing protein [Paenibacillus pini]|nr:AraC family transcriptional regulator [Paenibacillus pini]
MSIKTDRIELFKGANRFSNSSHAHDDWYQVTVPVQGTCHFMMENKGYQLAGGRGLIQHPGTEHYFHLEEQSSVIIVKFHNDVLQEMNDSRKQTEYGLEQWIDPLKLSQQFKNWTTDLMFGDFIEPLAIEETENKVLQYFDPVFKGKEHGVQQERICIPVSSDPHISLALEYMREFYTTSISIDELATIAVQSRYHFMRSFRAHTGMTPYQFLLKLRVEDAMNQLKRTKATVADISCGLGFASTSQFHRTFMKITGMTPSDFRRITCT